MKTSREKLKKGDTLGQEYYSEVIEANKHITESPSYQLLKEWYDPAYKKFKELVNPT